MAAETPLTLFTGVSKLPNGVVVVVELIWTWIACGEFAAPSALTVTTPLGPGVTLTCKVPFPTPDLGETVMLG